MNGWEALEPKRVLHYFREICAIPHGSGNTERISAYCLATAQAMGLDATCDEFGNVLIRKPASRGYEDHAPVILQGHLDMVCEKTADCELDMATEPIRLRVEGDWIFADSTTLGGDDGVAIAIALAILEDGSIPHPPLEVVFTTDEETGMDGAAGFDASVLKGRILLNADSECEGVLTVACAGGARIAITLPLTEESNTLPCHKICICGLRGGHSGVEIHRNRTNADILLGKLLHLLPKEAYVVSAFGGTKDNAIPSSAECTVAFDGDLTALVAAFAEQNRTEADPDLTVSVTAVATEPCRCDKASTRRIAGLLSELPNGVHAWDEHIDGLVETSSNLGQLRIDTKELQAVASTRSSVNRKKTDLLGQLAAIADKFGGTSQAGNFYPAWEYCENSRLRETMVRVYEELFGKKPIIEAIHAGLECGFFCEKIEGLDAVSFGPDILDIHTPSERLSISSLRRTYEYVLAILKEL